MPFLRLKAEITHRADAMQHIFSKQISKTAEAVRKLRLPKTNNRLKKQNLKKKTKIKTG